MSMHEMLLRKAPQQRCRKGNLQQLLLRLSILLVQSPNHCARPLNLVLRVCSTLLSPAHCPIPMVSGSTTQPSWKAILRRLQAILIVRLVLVYYECLRTFIPLDYASSGVSRNHVSCSYCRPAQLLTCLMKLSFFLKLIPGAVQGAF